MPNVPRDPQRNTAEPAPVTNFRTNEYTTDNRQANFLCARLESVREFPWNLPSYTYCARLLTRKEAL